MKNQKFAVVVLLVSSLTTSTALANQAVVLTDQELDQIHAGGLNFDFDAFLGSMGNTADKIAGNSVNAPTAARNPIMVFNDNEAIEVLGGNALQPASVSKVAAADAVRHHHHHGREGRGFDNANAPAHQTLANSGAPFSVKGPQSVDSPLTSMGGVTRPSAPDTASLIPAGIPVYDITAGRGGVTAAQSGITANDIYVDSTILNAAATNGNVNVIQMTDQAQQGLSSLVNVSAAGSIVPVLMNFNIIIDSTVGSINSSNGLNLNF